MPEKSTARIEGKINDAVNEERWRGLRMLGTALVGITMPVLLGTSSWAILEIVDLREKVRVIEATSYTREQAREDFDKVEKQRQHDRDATQALLKELAVQGARIESAISGTAENVKRLESELQGVKVALRERR